MQGSQQHNQQWHKVRPESIAHALVGRLLTPRNPAAKTPQQLLETVPFNLVFRAEDGTDVKTDTILSQDLADKDKTLLSTLREKGDL